MSELSVDLAEEKRVSARTRISMTDSVDSLKRLLARQPTSAPLSPREIQLLYAALSSDSTTEKSLALVLLSSVLAPTTTSTVLSDTTRQLKYEVQQLLAGTHDSDLQTGFNALAGIIQVAPQIGIGMLLDGTVLLEDEQEVKESTGLRKILEEAVEFVATSKAKQGSSKARIALLGLLSLTAGHSGTRSLVRRFAGDWLQSLLGNKVDEAGMATIGRGMTSDTSAGEEDKVVALAGLSVVKLLLGKETPMVALNGATPEKQLDWDVKDLVLLFRRLVIANSTTLDNSIILPSLEALAYLTLLPSPSTKSLLTTPDFLTAFSSILTPPLTAKPTAQEDTALEYAVATLLANLTAYPAPSDPSSEAEQLRRLKSFASAKSSASPPTPVVETPAQVNARINAILSITPPILPHLVSLSKSSSKAILRLTGKIYLHLCEQSSVRGKLIQGGAAKSLLRIIAKTITAKEESIEASELASIQALAKLLITNNPALVLVAEDSRYDAINALVIPLMLPIREDAEMTAGIALLIKFECLMALTNLAEREDCAERMARMSSPRRKGEDGKEVAERRCMSHLQDLLLHDNTLIRRATTELLCNLTASITGEAFYRPAQSSSTPAKHRIPPPVNLLIILISSDDLPTRAAAAGAMAGLCGQSMEIANSIILDEDEKRSDKNMGIILELLESTATLKGGVLDDNPMAFRGFCIVGGIIFSLERAGKEDKQLGLRRLTELDVKGKLERCTGLKAVQEVCMRSLVALST